MEKEETQEIDRRWVVLAGLGLGFGMGAGRGLWGLGNESVGRGVVWVADRWLGRLIELDQNLMPVDSFALDSPGQLAQGGGVLWAVAGPRSGRRLLGWSLAADRVQLVDHGLGRAEVLELWASPSGVAFLLVEAGAKRTLLGVGADAKARELRGLERASNASLGPSGLLCHDQRTAQWIAYGLAHKRAWVHAVAHEPLGFALAAATGDGGWWCATGGRGERLERRDARLRLIWSRPMGIGAKLLIATKNGVLLVSGKRISTQRFDLSGQASAPLESGARGPLCGAILLDDGFLLALPGALLRLTQKGEVHSFQGGFGEIAGLARASSS